MLCNNKNISFIKIHIVVGGIVKSKIGKTVERVIV